MTLSEILKNAPIGQRVRIADVLPKRPYVGIIIDGEIGIHMMHTTGAFATMCGIDGDDPRLAQYSCDVPDGAKINCTECRLIFDVVSRYSINDFKTTA